MPEADPERRKPFNIPENEWGGPLTAWPPVLPEDFAQEKDEPNEALTLPDENK